MIGKSDGDGDCSYWYADKPDADAAGPGWMAWYWFEALFYFGIDYLKFGKI